MTAGIRLDASGFLESDIGWQHVSTILLIFRYGDWFLKFRATYDHAVDDVDRLEVETLIDTLRWPAPAPNPSGPYPTAI